ncbi:MAG: winged helix-turn-helix transcriptional regulator [Nanoarchaeota archaeon]
MELKDKDIKLLVNLFKNSKKSNRELSKLCGYSKETIASKINFYEKNNYIKSFSVKINYNKLDFQEFNLFLRLKNMNQKIFKQIILYFENHKNVTWIGKSFGKYDLKISLILKNPKEINNLITQISNKYGKYIDLIDSLIIIDKFKASSQTFLNNLFEKKIQDTKPIISKKIKQKKEISIDEIDKQILYLLGENPKKSLISISKKFNFTPETIKYRIKNLEKQQIITGNSIVFNGNKFNKIWCLVLLNINPQTIEDFKKYLKQQTFLSNYSETLGIWNFNVTFFAKDIQGLYNDLNTLRNEFSQSIRNFEFLIFFDIYKYPKIPKCILE